MSRQSGKVKWFNASKGFGFIEPDSGGKDVFVHISALEAASIRGLSDRQSVSFETKSENGKVSAVNLELK